MTYSSANSKGDSKAMPNDGREETEKRTTTNSPSIPPSPSSTRDQATVDGSTDPVADRLAVLRRDWRIASQREVAGEGYGARVANVELAKRRLLAGVPWLIEQAENARIEKVQRSRSLTFVVCGYCRSRNIDGARHGVVVKCGSDPESGDVACVWPCGHEEACGSCFPVVDPFGAAALDRAQPLSVPLPGECAQHAVESCEICEATGIERQLRAGGAQ